ncbi:hypothetical protein [Enterocloster bolteae]|uniref:hypothetical protein n=1 Tax=Enterocloster bolteae TaxID=208479 RepID=UPI00210CDCBE|nr:hypothetical protein [Enterocloster bolteae]MCQ5144480.1 hypothetical protein [Enterocloster bolteae]
MDYEELERKKTLLEQKKAAVPKERMEQMEQDFEDEFIYNSMALSGSTLKREEVKAVLAAVRRKESAEKETE